MDLETFITKRLKVIQKKHNFNPNYGKKQIANKPELLIDYTVFAEYLKLIESLNLNIEIPYNPFNINKKTKLKSDKSYVYFARLMSNSSIWKIGFSKAPYKRGKTLQTANHESIKIIYQIPGARDLEQQILKFTIKFETNGGSEWRTLDIKQIKHIISTIKTKGVDALLKTSI